MTDERPAVMAIAAHPDDIEFRATGTMLLLKEAGWTLHYMNLCDGCCGTASEDVPTIRERRKREAQNACRLIGAQFYDSIAPDVELYHTTENVARVVSVIRRVKPRVLLLPSPNDYMEDHMNASRIGVTAAFARGMRNYPCVPHVDPIGQDVTLYHAMPHGQIDNLRRVVRAGQYVDVGSVIDTKRRMLACHASQKEWLDVSQGMDAYLEEMMKMAHDVGKLSGRFEYAEGWRRHSHMGFSPKDQDPMSEMLGKRCWTDPRYEASLNE